MKKQFKYEKGIATRIEEPKETLEQYQEKAKKFDDLRALALEELNLQRRKKQIGQERAKLLGVTEKYRE